jgi:hypothetical protein
VIDRLRGLLAPVCGKLPAACAQKAAREKVIKT